MKQTQLKAVVTQLCFLVDLQHASVAFAAFFTQARRDQKRERHVLPQTSVRGGVINLGLARRATSNVTAIYRAVYAGQC